MILLSTESEKDQSRAVTDTSLVTPTGHRAGRACHPGPPRARRTSDLADWRSIDDLFAFACARAVERAAAAEVVRDRQTARLERLSLHVMQTLYRQAEQQEGILVHCSVNYFRARAMRDADHVDFDGRWIGRAVADAGSS